MFEFVPKSTPSELGKEWQTYKLNFDGMLCDLTAESYKDGQWQPTTGAWCSPYEYFINQYDVSPQDLMVFIQEIAVTIGAELVLVRKVAHSLRVADPNHPERKWFTEAVVAFARKIKPEKPQFPSARI